MFSIRLSTSSRFLSFLGSAVAKPEPPFHQQVGAELYMRLGHAITQWAHVENALLKIFWKLQGEPVFRITSAIFHSPISDQVRIDGHCISPNDITSEDEPDLLLWFNISRLQNRLRYYIHSIALHV